MNPIFQTETWWDERGPFKILHTLMPLRMQWILRTLSCHPLYDSHDRDTPLKHMTILDVGCGGGLLCEPLSRLGAKVTGIDQSDQAIKCANDHKGRLDITYQCADIMSWQLPDHTLFDGVCLMEVLEHLDHPFLGIQHASRWLAEGGVLLGSTLNRTFLSYVLAIKMAENIFKWIPKGTHQWEKFLTPHEVQAMMGAVGLGRLECQGYKFSPPNFNFSRCQSVNYFFSGTLP